VPLEQAALDVLVDLEREVVDDVGDALGRHGRALGRVDGRLVQPGELRAPRVLRRSCTCLHP